MHGQLCVCTGRAGRAEEPDRDRPWGWSWKRASRASPDPDDHPRVSRRDERVEMRRRRRPFSAKCGCGVGPAPVLPTPTPPLSCVLSPVGAAGRVLDGASCPSSSGAHTPGPHGGDRDAPSVTRALSLPARHGRASINRTRTKFYSRILISKLRPQFNTDY